MDHQLGHNLRINLTPANRIQRLLAAIIDYLLFFSTYFTVVFLLAMVFPKNTAQMTLLFLIIYFSIYWLGFSIAFRATPGKQLFGLKTVAFADGKEESMVEMVIREIMRALYFVPILGLVFLIADGIGVLTTNDSRSFRDRLSGTITVKALPIWIYWKQLIIFLVILICSLAAIKGFTTQVNNKTSFNFVYKPQPTQTTTLPPANSGAILSLTPYSAKDNFSISYPQDWSAPTVQTVYGDMWYKFSSSNLFIIITSNKNYDQITSQLKDQTQEEKDSVIGGINAKEYSSTTASSTLVRIAVLKMSDGRIMEISMPFPSGTDPSFFDVILSTMKFSNS